MMFVHHRPHPLVVATQVFVLAIALMMTTAVAVPDYGTVAYYGVLHSAEPFAAYTELPLKTTSTVPYYSVVHEPY